MKLDTVWLTSAGARGKIFCSGDAGTILLWLTSLDKELDDPKRLQYNSQLKWITFLCLNQCTYSANLIEQPIEFDTKKNLSDIFNIVIA